MTTQSILPTHTHNDLNVRKLYRHLDRPVDPSACSSSGTVAAHTLTRSLYLPCQSPMSHLEEVGPSLTRADVEQSLLRLPIVSQDLLERRQVVLAILHHLECPVLYLESLDAHECLVGRMTWPAYLELTSSSVSSDASVGPHPSLVDAYLPAGNWREHFRVVVLTARDSTHRILVCDVSLADANPSPLTA